MRIRRPGARLMIAAALALVAVAAAGACTGGSEPSPPKPISPDWRGLSLPAPPAGERIALRTAAVCGGRWYVTGAFAGPDGATRPAAWTSIDGRTWTAMTVAAKSYYGHRAVLYTAACRDGRLAAVGGKPGGAHGNPRVSSWHEVPGPGGTEVLTEVLARFELYGGPYAVNVARLVAGPAGWLITGNRTSGAAVWLSPDAAEFRIVEAAPGLASEPGLETWAADAVAHRGAWTVVGGTISAGRFDRDPAAWTSVDGVSWRRREVPHTGEYDEMTLVVEQGDDLIAVGLNGPTFQAWRSAADTWTAAGRFGSTRPAPDQASSGPHVAPRTFDLAAGGGLLVAAVSDGVTIGLWASGDGGDRWNEMRAPISLPAGVDQAVALAGVPGASGGPDRLLLATDDGSAGRVYLADMPAMGGR